MDQTQKNALVELLMNLVPADGAAIGNQPLRQQFIASARALGHAVADSSFDDLRETLIEQGMLIKGKGRGGSVRLANTTTPSPLMGEGWVGGGKPESDFSLQAPEPQNSMASRKPKSAATALRAKPGDNAHIISYRHTDHRKNNPEVGMVKPENDPAQPQTAWAYDPHLDPALQFDIGRAQIETLIDDALESGDEAAMRAAPFENLPLRDAIDFYKHERDWANRLIAGDSLLVMNSLLQKESMAGQARFGLGDGTLEPIS